MAQLAQFNIGKLSVSADSEAFRSFLHAIPIVLAQADKAPGFVWREQYLGPLMGSGPFADDELATVTVWESFEALRDFTYADEHRRVFAARATWFRSQPQPSVVLWWVPHGHRPSSDEATAKLSELIANGPTPSAFTFARRFDPAEQAQPGS